MGFSDLLSKMSGGIQKVQGMSSQASNIANANELADLVNMLNNENKGNTHNIAQNIKDTKSFQLAEEARNIQQVSDINNIIQYGRNIRQDIINSNQQKKDEINKNDLKKEFLKREALRQKQLNYVKNTESFSFYTVKDLLTQGISFKNALDTAGMYNNTQYNLTRQGSRIVRLDENEIDNCCLSVSQNLLLIDLINNEQAIPVAVGNPDTSLYSMGCLIYNKNFGAVLLKIDRQLDSYITPIGLTLMAINTGKVGGFERLALCKSFVKVAFSGAICVNMIDGIETPEDLEMLSEIKAINPNGYNLLSKFIHKNLGIKGRWL